MFHSLLNWSVLSRMKDTNRPIVDFSLGYFDAYHRLTLLIDLVDLIHAQSKF